MRSEGHAGDGGKERRRPRQQECLGLGLEGREAVVAQVRVQQIPQDDGDLPHLLAARGELHQACGQRRDITAVDAFLALQDRGSRRVD